MQTIIPVVGQPYIIFYPNIKIIGICTRCVTHLPGNPAISMQIHYSIRNGSYFSMTAFGYFFLYDFVKPALNYDKVIQLTVGTNLTPDQVNMALAHA